MKMRNLLLLPLFCVMCFPVFSQEGEPRPVLETDDVITGDFSTDEDITNESSDSLESADSAESAYSTEYADSVFIINSFDFKIKGFTRPYAIVYKGELKKGEEIKGLSNLEKYIGDKTQLLMNERVLEKVTINYEIGAVREDGKYPVDLVLDIKDTWNIIALPYPKYSTNSGFEMFIKARDYNFLGTMSPLRLDIGYIYDELYHRSFLLSLDSNTPFSAFGLRWYLKFFNAFNYRPDTDQPYYYNNVTGLSVELPVKSTTVTIGFDESFHYNEENEDIYWEKTYTDKNGESFPYGEFQEGFYMLSTPYVSWKIPTGFHVWKWGELEYTPRISTAFYHEFPRWPLQDIRKGPVLKFRHILGFNHVDWIGNFQRGVDVYIDNSFNYNFYKSAKDRQALDSALTLSGIGHFILTDFFGISTNIKYRQWFFYEYGYTKAGDVMRGIVDKSVAKDIGVDLMLSLNLDFPVRVLRFSPSKWLDKDKLRFFNFDLHVSPILDTAFYRDLKSKNDVLVSGGVEFIVFPDFFRSLHLRISLGWDLIDRSYKRYEIFVGTDFHY